jgi:hypothetical protein
MIFYYLSLLKIVSLKKSGGMYLNEEKALNHSLIYIKDNRNINAFMK